MATRRLKNKKTGKTIFLKKKKRPDITKPHRMAKRKKKGGSKA